MSDQLEIKASDGLAPARRNFLFSNSLLFVLGVGNPKEIALPGFGDVAMPGVAAIAMVATSVVWFLYEYSLEYKLTRTRNSEILAPSREVGGVHSTGAAMSNLASMVDRLGSNLREVVGLAKSQVEKSKGDQNIELLGKQIASFTDTLADFENRFPDNRAFDDGQPLTDTRQAELIRIASSLQGVASGLYNLKAEWQAGNEKWYGTIDNEVEEILRKIHALHGDLRRVSDNVHVFQRRALLWKDLVLIAAFAGCSLCLAAARIGLGIGSVIGQLDPIAATAAALGALLGLLIVSREIRLQFKKVKPSNFY